MRETIDIFANWDTLEPLTFDSLIMGGLGIDSYDDLTNEEAEIIENHQTEVIAFMDSLGIDEHTLNDFISNDTALSGNIGQGIAKAVQDNYTDDDIQDRLSEFDSVFDASQFDDDLNAVEFDRAMPKMKAGYKRKQVIRDGKKTWINKRLPSKKIILSAKQRQGLRKARLKSQTGRAKINRARSLRKRKTFGLK